MSKGPAHFGTFQFRRKKHHYTKTIQTYLKIASSLSIIIGICFSLIQVHELVENAHRADVNLRLTSFDKVKSLLDRDLEIKRKGRAFLDEEMPSIQGKEMSLIEQYRSGEKLYLSEKMKAFAEIHYHYELLGTLVKLDIIESPLLFNSMAFPDEYTEKTDKLVKVIRDNWGGKGQALRDFGENTDFLKKCFAQLKNSKDHTKKCEIDKNSDDIPIPENGVVKTGQNGT